MSSQDMPDGFPVPPNDREQEPLMRPSNPYTVLLQNLRHWNRGDDGDLGEEAAQAIEQLQRERNEAVTVSQNIRADFLELMDVIQRYQPSGSPPPGGGVMIARWVLQSLAKRASDETRDTRTTDEKLAELQAQCQDLWRTDVTMVCRLPKGHEGDHRGDNGWTWNGPSTAKASEQRDPTYGHLDGEVRSD